MGGNGTGADRLTDGLAAEAAGSHQGRRGRGVRIPDRPLARLPRWAALLLAALFVATSAWTIVSLGTRDLAHNADIAERTARGGSKDMDLYRAVHAEVRAGENYYAAATQANRAMGYPTRPFVTIRTPVLAWGAKLWGDFGWRAIAAILWVANAVAWVVALGERASDWEKRGAMAFSLFGGAAALIPEVPYSHELQSGLLISLGLALATTRWWPGALLAIIFGIAFRELAAPFLLAWGAVALVAGDRRKLLAIAVAAMLVAVGLWLHAQGVEAQLLPGDQASPGWSGMHGPSLAFYGINLTTLLQTMPAWIAGPLCVLSLLGWIALGGRMGVLATLWFGGFIFAVSVFARQENFYWMALFVPAYCVGLAFVPRALRDLRAAIMPRPVSSART